MISSLYIMKQSNCMCEEKTGKKRENHKISRSINTNFICIESQNEILQINRERVFRIEHIFKSRRQQIRPRMNHSNRRSIRDSSPDTDLFELIT
jgi:hypothetical protein